jgi:hypothetical protein
VETHTCVDCAGDGDCGDPAPRCEPVSNACVQCLAEEDCAAVEGRTLCDESAHECVACLSHDDCAVVGLPRCDGGVCVACTPGGDECAAVGTCFADNPNTTGDDAMEGAFTGACVACNEDADCDGGDECDAWTHACVVPSGAVNQCQACVTDGDCDAGSGCVEVSFEGTRIGTYCALDGCADEGDPDFYCAGNVGRGNRCQTVTTRAGATGDYCVPATTTCEGYLHHRLACVGVQGVCSHDGDGGDADGVCVAGTTCSYPCAGDGDCPGGYDCGDDVPGNCNVN